MLDEDERYEATEISFLPAVRWLLTTALAVVVGEADSAIEIGNLLSDCATSEDVVSRNVLEALASGRLYELLTAVFINKAQSTSFPATTDSDGTFASATTLSGTFLRQLVEAGLLKFSPALCDSVMEMLGDVDPFYEAVHLNVIEAFMNARTPSITLESLTDHIKSFPNFNATRDTPYDVEDALLIWIAHICHAVSQRHAVVQMEESLEEMDDLIKDIGDGRALACVVLYNSNDPTRILKRINWTCPLSTADQRQNMDIVLLEIQQLGCAVPWTFDDYERSLESGSWKKVIVSSVCELFDAVTSCKSELLHSRAELKHGDAEAASANVAAMNEDETAATACVSPVGSDYASVDIIDDYLSSEMDHDHQKEKSPSTDIAPATESKSGSRDIRFVNMISELDSVCDEITKSYDSVIEELEPVYTLDDQKSAASRNSTPFSVSGYAIDDHRPAQSPPPRPKTWEKPQQTLNYTISFSLGERLADANVDRKNEGKDRLALGDGDETTAKSSQCSTGRCNFYSLAENEQNSTIIEQKRAQMLKRLQAKNGGSSGSQTALDKNDSTFTQVNEESAVDPMMVVDDLNAIQVRREQVLQRLEHNRKMTKNSAGESGSSSQNSLADGSATPLSSPRKAPSSNSPVKTPRNTRSANLSNRQLVKNAVLHILGSRLHDRERKEVVELIDRSAPSNNFLLLLRSKDQFAYRALYEFDVKRNVITKAHGSGPDTVQSATHYFKYDSSNQRFRPMHLSEFTRSIHAFAL